jgi:hypothetical protein
VPFRTTVTLTVVGLPPPGAVWVAVPVVSVVRVVLVAVVVVDSVVVETVVAVSVVLGSVVAVVVVLGSVVVGSVDVGVAVVVAVVVVVVVGPVVVGTVVVGATTCEAAPGAGPVSSSRPVRLAASRATIVAMVRTDLDVGTATPLTDPFPLRGPATGP